LFRKIEDLNTLHKAIVARARGGTTMSNLSPEIERKLRNLDPEDMKKVTGFFYLVEEGDKLATEIWSMANNKGIEPEQVADLIYGYMDFIYDHILHQSKSQPEDENMAPLGHGFDFFTA